MNKLEQKALSELESLQRQSLRRYLRSFDSFSGPTITLNGQLLINFSSNDYLGLATAPFLRKAFADAALTYGVGSAASRLISGTLPPHTLLESAIAQFKQTEAALCFASGWQTAAGVIPAIVSQNDVILLDKLAHACLVDAARLSGAKLRVFPHNDTRRLRHLLEWATSQYPSSIILIITESVFSMDGDLCPLEEIVQLKDHYGACLLLDEAHAIGVIGPQGSGLAAHLNLSHRIELQMGTLGKALGVAGGYIACSKNIADWLTNRARSFIFSTAPPPPVAAAALAALRWLLSPEAQTRIAHLTHLRNQIPNLLPSFAPTPPPAAILPILLGDEKLALQTSQQLLNLGIFAPCVRFPAVPRAKARLRISLSAAHSLDHLHQLAHALQKIIPNIPPPLTISKPIA